MNEKIGIIDVGGGMKGIYGAGIFDYLLERNIEIPYCIGVSAGSANVASYLSKQKGRNQVTLADVDNMTSWQDVAIDAFVDILTQNKIPFNRNTANELLQKLRIGQQDSSGTSTKETLYSIADTISKSYMPLLTDGNTKNKVSLFSKIYFKLSNMQRRN